MGPLVKWGLRHSDELLGLFVFGEADKTIAAK
jgi:hypothetical protein